MGVTGSHAAKAVRDVMTQEVVTVTPETSFREAVRLMEERRIDALPVVEGDRVVGMIAESDLLLKEELVDLPTGGTGLPWQRRRDRARASARLVREAMSRAPATINPDATLSAAARVMHRRRVGGLPVVEGDQRLVGIVTRSDLLKVFLRSDDEIAADIREALGGLADQGIHCDVSDGCVTLHGEVRLHSDATRAVTRVAHIPGVVHVDCTVRWQVDDVNVAMVGP